MRENKLNIVNELKELKIKHTIDVIRSKRLQMRWNDQVNVFIDNFIKANIDSITSDKDKINVDTACIAIEKSGEEWHYYKYTNIVIIYFNSEGDYTLDCETHRIIESFNYSEYITKTNILINTLNLCEFNKEYLKKSYLDITLRYNNLREKLQIRETEYRIDELKRLLVKMEEDLLLEVGNVYVHDPNTKHKIIESNSKEVICEESGHFERSKFLSKIRKKELTPDKVTERRIKLKRVLYAN